MKLFLDTSAYIKHFIQEPGSVELENLLAEATDIGFSILCLPETISTFCRLRREGRMNTSQYKKAKNSLLEEANDAFLIQLTSNVVWKATEILEKHSIRTLDSIHIASALEWKAELFVSADHQQRNVAKKTGLAIQNI